jgi:hypothetical protein
VVKDWWVDTEFEVGDRNRRRAGMAVMASLAVCACYAAFTMGTKEIPALYVHQPWQDDPYDVLVSLDFAALPLLVTMTALRVQLCRRSQRLPARRLADLLRACGLAAGLCLLTQAAEWIAVARGSHRDAWNAASVAQVTALVALTVASLAAAVTLVRARRAMSRSVCLATQPDWLADAVAGGLHVADLAGPARALAVRAVHAIDRQLIGRIRTHPIAAALILAVVLTLPGVAAKALIEGYSVALLLFVFGVSTASLFAFSVLAGGYLRVVAASRPRPPVWLSAVVAACVAGPLAFAFRSPLQSMLGLGEADETVGRLTVLMIAAGALAAAVTTVGKVALGHHQDRSLAS